MKRCLLAMLLVVGMGAATAQAQGRHLGERYVVPHNPGHERVVPRPPPRERVYVAPRRHYYEEDDVVVRPRRHFGPRIELDFD